MRKYDHLYFDLDHTLWDFETNSKLAMQQTVCEIGLDKQVTDFDNFFTYYETINTKLWQAYRKQQIRKQELIRKRFEDTLNHFNIQGIDPLDMNEHYLKLMPLQKQLYPGVIETLDYLKQKRYQMHIITNGFTEVQRGKVESSGLNAYFDRIFISEEVQAPKPDKRIFQHALKCCNAKKKKSMMIGDSWEADILGAKGMGINQVLVLDPSSSQTRPPEDKWGENKGHYFQHTNSSTTTYIVTEIGKLTKLL
ncbi:YjjG family noncanonical pyrimidine nucleotidase [Sunxiuqinia sp. sy24]|uniref:YjjG family noncanonical pyrimidine nucleotidase n=1 Tax=Sunxiuqinia sp. sy24 TaxID=3461495 RepID=UPI0040456C4D